MSRTYYSYAIFFAALAGILTFIQGITYVVIGARLFELASTRTWILLVTAVTVVNMFIMLGYFRFRNYHIVVWAVAGVIITTVLQAFSFLRILRTHELTSFYALTAILSIAAGIVFGVSLLLSAKKERYWLKIAGFSLFIVGLLGLTTIGWALISLDARVNGTIEILDKVQSLAQCLIPIFFIVNFLDERSSASPSAKSAGMETAIGLVALVIVIATPVLALQFINEALWRNRNPDFVGEGARRLAAPFDARSFVGASGDTLRYRLMMPLDYDSAKKYPVVVCLHGSSGTGHDNVKQIASCLPAAWLANEENRKKYPAILFVPQCPDRMTWGGLEGSPSVGGLVTETLLALQRELPIDTTRRYIAGNSMGGYGTWLLAGSSPEIFAAAIPICGGGDPMLASNLATVPIWAFHGEKDMNVPVSGSRDVIDAIKKAGGKPLYTEFPGKAHDITKEVVATPGLLDWLFAQKKDSL